LDVAGAHFSWALDSSGVQINWTLDFLRAQIGLGLGLGQRVNRPIHSFSSFPFFFLSLFRPSPILVLTGQLSLSFFSAFKPVFFLLIFSPSFFLFFSLAASFFLLTGSSSLFHFCLISSSILFHAQQLGLDGQHGRRGRGVRRAAAMVRAAEEIDGAA
jgi:hypothetical protein